MKKHTIKHDFDYIEDRMNRYIYQVTKHMTPSSRKDIEIELKTLIYDMLESGNQGIPAALEDLNKVLRELGNPRDLAEKYQDTSRYLIRPESFPIYLMVLKIVLGAALIGISIATSLELFTSEISIGYRYIGTWLGNLFNTALSAFGFVTLIFALAERNGMNIKDLEPEWDADSLPPVPVKEFQIPISEPIAGIIFTTIGITVFASLPHLFKFYHHADNVRTVIPLFNSEAFQMALPLFLIAMSLGLLRNIWELIDRKYSIPYAIFAFVLNTVSTILTVVAFTAFDVWNPDFGTQLDALRYWGSDFSVASAWNIITSNFVAFLIIIYILETIFAVIKALKYSRPFNL
ncbi:hypothetical protein HNQ56_001125 [Anaerotaenia torta]|uniref:hypothetical protein n=1 Tax=Anaerotaenia torta TaxID=433293 RepID=UPI003D1F5C37